jgi:hypothetical protein
MVQWVSISLPRPELDEVLLFCPGSILSRCLFFASSFGMFVLARQVIFCFT